MIESGHGASFANEARTVTLVDVIRPAGTSERPATISGYGADGKQPPSHPRRFSRGFCSGLGSSRSSYPCAKADRITSSSSDERKRGTASCQHLRKRHIGAVRKMRADVGHVDVSRGFGWKDQVYIVGLLLDHFDVRPRGHIDSLRSEGPFRIGEQLFLKPSSVQDFAITFSIFPDLS